MCTVEILSSWIIWRGCRVVYIDCWRSLTSKWELFKEYWFLNVFFALRPYMRSFRNFSIFLNEWEKTARIYKFSFSRSFIRKPVFWPCNFSRVMIFEYLTPFMTSCEKNLGMQIVWERLAENAEMLSLWCEWSRKPNFWLSGCYKMLISEYIVQVFIVYRIFWESA